MRKGNLFFTLINGSLIAIIIFVGIILVHPRSKSDAANELAKAEVNVIREFRDEYLVPNAIGKWLVEKYSMYAPPVVEFISKHESLQRVVRIGIVLPVKGFCYLTLKIPSHTKLLLLLISLALIASIPFWKKTFQRLTTG